MLKTIYLEVRESNSAAIAFYGKHGFAKTGRASRVLQSSYRERRSDEKTNRLELKFQRLPLDVARAECYLSFM